MTHSDCVTWIIPSVDGEVKYNNKFVRLVDPAVQAVIVQVNNRVVEVIEECTEDLVQMTVTCDSKGKVVFISESALGLSGKYLVNEYEGTLIFKAPATIGRTYSTYIALPEDIDVYGYYASEQDGVTYTYGLRDGMRIVLFGGKSFRPDTFSTGSLLYYVKGDKVVRVEENPICTVDVLYAGDTMYLPSTKIVVAFVDTTPIPGYTYSFEVPKAVLISKEVGIFYPYSPDGSRRYRVKPGKDVSDLRVAVESEVLELMRGRGMSELVSTIHDVIADAPESVKKDIHPIVGALHWALALSKGGL